MRGKFCPKCGKENTDFYEGLCIECFEKTGSFVDLPEEIEITKCKRCGMWFYKHKWIQDSFLSLKKIIKDKMKIRLYGVKTDVDIEDDELSLQVIGFIDPEKMHCIERIKKSKVVFKNTSCEKCIKTTSRSFEHKIQLRRADEFDPVLFERIEKAVKKKIDKMKIDFPEAEAFWFEENRDGVDFFFGFKSVGEAIVKLLRSKYKLEYTRSSTLAGLDKKTGKKKFKLTFCFRV